MEKEKKGYGAYVLVVPFPSPGHINPLLQLCKRLVSKGLKATLAVTKSISKTMNPQSDTVHVDTISDGI
ncbi:unnamed protein product [Ilex paraguariensis]|uniref:Glycosyltransferase N-terminal domain-containing protein n=1 Tax=Ilex paraguariensis TaxID=185542 RepID=A0ABC8R9I5_9AQUA